MTQTCVGMSYELWRRMAELADINYTIKALNYSSTSALNTTHEFDISISVTSINPSRIQALYFTQPIVEVEFVGVLKSRFARPGPTLLTAIFSRGVLFLFGLLVLMVLVLSNVVMLAESRHKDSAVMNLNAWYKRLLYSLETSLTNALTLDGGDYSSQISRSLRVVFIIAMYFFSCLFTSILTNTITDAAIGVGNPNIVDARGANIWCGESTDMRDYLVRVGCVTNYTATLAPFAFQILEGTLEADGFVTSTDEAKSFVSNYPDAGFVLTDPFTITGLREPRALGIARNVSLELVNDLAVALSMLREGGVVADLLAAYVPNAVQSGGDISLGISTSSEMRLRIVTIVLMALTFGIIGMLWVIHSKRARKEKEEQDASRQSRQSKASFEMDGSPSTSCHMITSFQTDNRGRFVPVSCTVVSPGGPALTAGQIPTSQLESLKYMLKLCQKGD